MSATNKTAIDTTDARRLTELQSKLTTLDKEFERHNKLIRPRAMRLLDSIKFEMNRLESDYLRYLVAQSENGSGIYLNLASDGAIWFFNKEAIIEKFPEIAFRIIGGNLEHQRKMGGDLSYAQIVRERSEIRAELARLTEPQADEDEQAAA